MDPGSHLTPLHLIGDNTRMLDQFRAHIVARHVAEIDPDTLLAHGITGVMLDLDNTLTAWNCREVDPAVREWIARLRASGLQACIVSNAASVRRVLPVAECLGLQYVIRALKPLPGGFRRAMRLMGTTPATTAVVGDQVFTDVFGGNLLGVYAILVEPTGQHESIFTRILQRPLERLIGRVPKETRSLASKKPSAP